MNDKIKQSITELKKLIKQSDKNKQKIEELEQKLFEELCSKDYLDKCEPEYCVFRITDSCEYLKTIRKIYN